MSSTRDAAIRYEGPPPRIGLTENQVREIVRDEMKRELARREAEKADK
jgi:hypothetical protein